jgi:hypothetical protein
MTFVNLKQVDIKSFNPKKDIIQIILFVIGLITIVYFIQNKRDKKLLNPRYSFALVSDKSKVYLGDYEIYYKYQTSKQILEYRNTVDVKKFNKLELGDTILIKYSIEDNEIAQIVHCYWNDDLRKIVEEQDIEPTVK